MPLRFFLAGIFLFFFCRFSWAQIPVFKKQGMLVALPTLSYTPQTQWAFGATASLFGSLDSSKQVSSLNFDYKYTELRQTLAELKWNLLMPGNRWRHRGTLGYRYFPDVFYGIGAQATNSAKEYYTTRSLELRFRSLRNLGGRNFAGLFLQYFQYNIPDYQANGVLDKGILQSQTEAYITGLGLMYAYDSREHTISPRGGAFVEMECVPFVPSALSQYGFLHTRFDGRWYRKLNERQVFSFQVFAHYLWGDAPFRYFLRISSGSWLRGLAGNRYTDKGVWLLQAEWRSQLWYFKKFKGLPSVGINVFGGTGNVFADSHDLLNQSPKWALGAGLRIMLDEKNRALLRYDRGFSGQNAQNYLDGGEAW